MLKFDNHGQTVFPTRYGPVALAWTPQGVKRLILGLDEEKTRLAINKACPDFPLVQRPRGDVAQLIKRIKAHLKGKCEGFLDVPVVYPSKGEFSVTVLKQLRKIPPSKVVTYGELAARSGNPKAARAVGGIMGANPIPLIIPCHRCLGKDGSMTGFSTEGGIDLKSRMLFDEGYVANTKYAAGMEHLSKVDPVMRKIIKNAGPYRALPDKREPAWDALITAIVHQQLSIKAGITICKRVRGLTSGKGYPTPVEILNMPPEDLRSVGLSNQKVSYVRNLATHIQDGTLKLSRLKNLPDEAVIEELTKVKGIGRWSAQMHLIFHLDRLDVLPTGDLGLLIGAAKAYRLNEKATVAQLEEIAEKWVPYRSMGSWYLWWFTDGGGV
ncbi:MAG: methylated-DNA--[protein]-cysteine S-methyltransferase [bacterium]|nr:methylated-DNA--[protein]-cysteine S-methyltransferase [bacterium]